MLLISRELLEHDVSHVGPVLMIASLLANVLLANCVVKWSRIKRIWIDSVNHECPVDLTKFVFYAYEKCKVP